MIAVPGDDVNPIIMLTSPPASSPPNRLTPLDWLRGSMVALVKSGTIAAILGGIQAIDLDKLTVWQAFGVSFVVLLCTTLNRLYFEGTPEPTAKPKPPVPDDPAEWHAIGDDGL